MTVSQSFAPGPDAKRATSPWGAENGYPSRAAVFPRTSRPDALSCATQYSPWSAAGYSRNENSWSRVPNATTMAVVAYSLEPGGAGHDEGDTDDKGGGAGVAIGRPDASHISPEREGVAGDRPA
jgi:hypothetical protein